MNWRMIGPTNVAHQTRTVNGRTYTAIAGQMVTVPDFDGSALQANGWTFLCATGPTTSRPTGTFGQYPAIKGVEFFDETLGKIIKHDGLVWRDPANGAAV